MDRRIWTRNFSVSIGVLTIAIITQMLCFFTSSYLVDRIAYWSLSIANLMAINYLYKYGTFSRSRWKNIQFLFVAVYIMGILFKIQHWEGNRLLLTLAWCGAPLCYTLWFFSKPVKQLTDILKVLWIVLFCVLTLLKELHWFDSGITGLVLITGLLYFIYIKFHFNRILRLAINESEWDFDRPLKPD